MKRGIGLAAILVVVSVGFTGCASNKLKESEIPDVVYNEGNRLFEKEDYLEAAEFFNEVRHRFPQSRFAALAELRTADVEFRQDNFTEAAAAYGTFLDLYPNHSDAAYAQYQRAISYFNDAPEKIARDQSTAQNAANAADQLMKRYPKSDYVTKARDIFERSRIRLAQKEAYIAAFYERRDAKLAAYRRWQGILKSYADLANFKDKPEALSLIADAEKKSQILGGQLETQTP